MAIQQDLMEAAGTTTLSKEKPYSSPLSLAAAVAVLPLAFGVVATGLKLLLWRARVVSSWLDEDSLRVWSDGSMMVRHNSG